MAEDNTIKKQRNPWPWIIGIFLFVVISWVLYEYLRDHENSDDGETPYIRESVIRDADDNSKSTPADTMELNNAEEIE